MIRFFVFLFLFVPTTSLADFGEIPGHFHPVVEYFNSHGIFVEKRTDSPTLSGGQSYDEKISPFLDELEKVKGEFVNRKNDNNRIYISTYTRAQVSSENLILDINHDATSCLKYLELFDKKVALFKAVALKINWFDDLKTVTDEEFVHFSATLSFWNQNVSKVNELSSLFNEIRVLPAPSQISLLYGEMRLRDTEYQQTFQSFYLDFVEAAKVFHARDPKNTEMEIWYNPGEDFDALVEILRNNQAHFDSILDSGLLKAISFGMYQDTDSTFVRGVSKVIFAKGEQPYKDLSEVLKALSFELELANTSRLEFHFSQYHEPDLNEGYFNSVNLLRQFKGRILAEMEIDKIELNYSEESKYEEELKKLYIGKNATPAELLRVLDSIE